MLGLSRVVAWGAICAALAVVVAASPMLPVDPSDPKAAPTYTILPNSAAQSVSMDIEAELQTVREICTQADVEGAPGVTSVSSPCARHLQQRVQALERLVSSPEGAEFAATLNATYRGRVRALSQQKCRGSWTGECCNGASPSPMCVAGVMHGCGCNGGSCEASSYTCAWYPMPRLQPEAYMPRM